MYDFKSLSSYDFELLVRDLLQEDLNIRLESFKVGRDQGIDLRYAPASGELLIVQCKHFANTGFRGLLRNLEAETQKIKTLSPSRYCLATSVALTPANKAKIVKILKPFCATPQDIYGKEDLNNLLSQFPAVERRHFKLWLTSTAVLDRLLHSRHYTQSAVVVDRIRSKAKFYVQNESFSQALKILQKNNYCVISGIPGIGKTFLAEILLLYYLENKYEPIIVRSHISEAFELLDGSKLQVFFYDDFLGLTGWDEKLAKNEEKSILDFIKYVQAHNHVKFILTTREYILQQARQAYEKLQSLHIDDAKCIIELESYTRRDRARILFNHLYFSSLPNEHRKQLCLRENLLPIIDHQNYSPRIVDWMSDSHQNMDCSATDYPSRFLEFLSNPNQLWRHAFDIHISPTSRSVLLVMMTFRSRTPLEDFRKAVHAFLENQQLYDITKSSIELQNSLDELEGSFLQFERAGAKVWVTFHNPSVLDFLEAYISEHPETLLLLCSSLVYYDQFLALCRRRGSKPEHDKIGAVLEKEPQLLADTIMRTFERKVIQVLLIKRQPSGHIPTLHFVPGAIEARIVHAIRTARDLPAEVSEPLISKLLAVASGRVRRGNADVSVIPEIIKAVSGVSACQSDLEELIAAMVSHVQSKHLHYYELSEFETVYEFEKVVPGRLSADIKAGLAEVFKSEADTIFDNCMDPSLYDYELFELSDLAKEMESHFKVDLSGVLERIEYCIEDLGERGVGGRDEVDLSELDESDDADDDEIMDIFAAFSG